MKKFIAAFVIIFSCSINLLTAQNSKPVQLSFYADRLNDSIIFLVAKAKLEKNIQLFSVKKSDGNNPFISSINLDSSSKKFIRDTDTATEKGNLQLIKTSNDNSLSRMFEDSVEFRFPLHIFSSDSATIKGSFIWLAKKDNEFPSGEEKFSVKINPEKKVITNSVSSTDASRPINWWNYFWIGLLAGLATVFFPCIYPLMPVTITYFINKHKSHSQGIRDALIYSLSIILIYGIPTTALTLAFGNGTLYKISINPITNLLFFAIFIIFALSFFGLFEITLPSSWANKTDAASGKRGFIGIFFMALTLVIVSFSCTGIVAGQLLGYLSSEGLAIGPIVGMFGFGTGLALPFTILAMFPSLLKSLPKSGGWLNTLKVSFAFIELAMALKFLSNVDLIYHWHLLDREVFLALWIVIFILLGFYLLGKIRFSHDSEVRYVSIPRLFFAIACFSFVVYLIPGMWGAPLKSLSGWVPPSSTQDFNLNDLKYNSAYTNFSADNSTNNSLHPKLYTDKLQAPLGLTAYFDLNEGMVAAKTLNKPVMLDFTGHSCANCRKMEGEVWSDPEVLKRIKNDFVVISLYVDESAELPEAQQYTKPNGEKITTVGEKNLDYEITKFGFNSQPLYMFLDLQGNPLSEIKYGYDADVQKFINHLETVKAEFNKRK
ncbi:MAG: protein-disulfide reductase DsbD family protein [Chitinophagaceae bacterium]